MKVLSAPVPPSPLGLLRESLTVLEVPRLLWRVPALARQPRGTGAPVLVIPGYAAGDTSTTLLRAYLRYLGYDARGWGLGINGGQLGKLVPQVVARVQALAESSGQPVHLIGWSLGGTLARDVVRHCPQQVAQVLTLGSPAVGGPKYTVTAPLYRLQGMNVDAIAERIDTRNQTPLPVPLTAIYTRHDAVVAWEACIDPLAGPGVRHEEVRTTHLGLVLAPEALLCVARCLNEHKSEQPDV